MSYRNDPYLGDISPSAAYKIGRLEAQRDAASAAMKGASHDEGMRLLATTSMLNFEIGQIRSFEYSMTMAARKQREAEQAQRFARELDASIFRERCPTCGK